MTEYREVIHVAGEPVPQAKQKRERETMLRIYDDAATDGESLSGIIHCCDLCGKRGRWTDAWTWFGSAADEECEIILKVCGCKSISTTDAMILLESKRVKQGLPKRPRVVCGGYGLR